MTEVKVTQEDRDAAAAFCGVDISDGKKVRGQYEAIYGPRGYAQAVQAFARHREAAEQPLREKLEKAREALESAHDRFVGIELTKGRRAYIQSKARVGKDGARQALKDLSQ